MASSLIAIVDDDEAVLRATRRLMRSLGYQVSTFGSAEEFLGSEQIRDTTCLITDLHMPGMSGIELQDRLVAEGRRIPVIFTTGYPDENVRMRAMKAGAIGFFTKPCNDNQLLDCLGSALKGH